MRPNLLHSKSATGTLITLMNEGDIDVSIIQEPWVKDDTIKWLNSSKYYKGNECSLHSHQ